MTSVITSGSTGFGVGVGLALQSGGGGGMSLTVCPCVVGVDRKMASTPIRNAGHKSFFSTPRIIFDTLRAVSCRQSAGLHVFLSYRFSDGMIHDSLVSRKMRGVAHDVKLRAATLVIGTGTRSTRIHCRRWRRESLVDEQLDFNTSILRATFTCFVLPHWIHFTVAVRRHDSAQRNVVVLNEVTNHCISTTLAQLAIHVYAAARIRKTGNLKHVAFRVQSLARNVVQRGLR